MNPPSVVEAISLFYREGSSNKVYRISILPSEGGYVVNFSYGRRGALPRSGSKTPAPVALDQARLIYNGVIAEKVNKGYVPEMGSPPLALMQTKEDRASAFACAADLQNELWSRNYGHSWGIREEFATLISAHPEILTLPTIKEAADAVLRNLPEWSPTLAAKEAKAKAACFSPEQFKELEARTTRLIAAIEKKTQVGPDEAKVSVCNFDHTRDPGIKPGTWAVLLSGRPVGLFDSQEMAMARAQQLVERAAKFDGDIAFNSDGTFAVTISARKIVT
jgi:hypothetical protein